MNILCALPSNANELTHNNFVLFSLNFFSFDMFVGCAFDSIANNTQHIKCELLIEFFIIKNYCSR